MTVYIWEIMGEGWCCEFSDGQRRGPFESQEEALAAARQLGRERGGGEPSIIHGPPEKRSE